MWQLARTLLHASFATHAAYSMQIVHQQYQLLTQLQVSAAVTVLCIDGGKAE